MKAPVKLLISLAAVLAAGWIVHGPLGRGEAFVAATKARAEAVIQAAEMDQVTVAFGHDPLTRLATLSGEADDFQRNGMGSLPGLTGRVAAMPGVGGVRWSDDPGRAPFVLPLLVETEALALLAWAVGLGCGWLLARRRRRESFL
jgi:OOP family OmpA-OmpF porin